MCNTASVVETVPTVYTLLFNTIYLPNSIYIHFTGGWESSFARNIPYLFYDNLVKIKKIN